MAHQKPASEYVWRGGFENTEVERLHAEAFDHSISDYDWNGQLERSLGWVTARSDDKAREARCEWLHGVDFEDHLEDFYVEACGFRATKEGLIDLTR